MRTFVHRLGQPKFIRRVNGWFTVFWAIWFVPAIAVRGLRDSVFLVGLYSIWANLISHYTAWIAARTEVRTEQVEVDIESNGADVRVSQ